MRDARFPRDRHPDTAYKAARQEWDNRMGGALVQARNWRFATFLSLIGYPFCIAGMAWVASRPIPVDVIEVDKLGDASFHRAVGTDLKAFEVSEVQISFHLTRFVQSVRMVTSDHKLTAQMWESAIAMCPGRCNAMLMAWVAQNKPTDRSARETVTIEILAKVQMTTGTWQIDWQEKLWDLDGSLRRIEKWRGMFRVQMRQVPRDKRALNPLGLFIDEFHWDKIGG